MVEGVGDQPSARQAEDALDDAVNHGRISAWRLAEDKPEPRYYMQDGEGRFGPKMTAEQVLELLADGPAGRAQPHRMRTIPVEEWILFPKADHPYGDGMPRYREDLTPDQQAEFDAVMLEREPQFEEVRRLLAGGPLKKPEAESADEFEPSDDPTPAEHEEC